MIAHLLTGLTILLLLVNLAGLAVLAERVTRNYLLARAASPVALCLFLFFVEHFVGLGSLGWVWPFTTLASVALLWRGLDLLRRNWRTEAVFLTGFGYAFVWRFAFPDLNGQSERLTDLGFILNYIDGAKLPPVDRWLPPNPFDVYYAFQHYCAALLGRILGLNAGFTYHLGLCTVVGLAALGTAGAVHLLGGKRWHVGLALVLLLAGGNGASLFVSQIVEAPAFYTSMRLIGGSVTPQMATQPFGRWLVHVNRVPEKEALELPAENFSYLIALGDYHPPISGFFLLALALLCIAMLEREESPRWAQLILAATIPITIASNAWNLPLQGLLVAGWGISRMIGRKPLDLLALAAGLFAGFVLIFPFLTHFAMRSLDYNTALLPVRPGEHTPWMLALFQFYPLFGVLLLQILCGVRSRVAWSFLALWLTLIVFSEVFYIDDVYSGRFNRFNSTLKWWPWIYTGALLTTGLLNLQSKSRICRIGTVLCLLAACGYSAHLGFTLLGNRKPHIGQMDGAGWIRDDAVEKRILEHLRQQPKSIVLQRIAKGAFTKEPGLVMHAGQTSFIGWPEHEKLWRGWHEDIEIRKLQMEAFYRGALPNSDRWLRDNNIRHVLWLKDEAQLPEGTFQKINQGISPGYAWREFYVAGEFRVGLWSRVE